MSWFENDIGIIYLYIILIECPVRKCNVIVLSFCFLVIFMYNIVVLTIFISIYTCIKSLYMNNCHMCLLYSSLMFEKSFVNTWFVRIYEALSRNTFDELNKFMLIYTMLYLFPDLQYNNKGSRFIWIIAISRGKFMATFYKCVDCFVFEVLALCTKLRLPTAFEASIVPKL